MKTKWTMPLLLLAAIFTGCERASEKNASKADPENRSSLVEDIPSPANQTPSQSFPSLSPDSIRVLVSSISESYEAQLGEWKDLSISSILTDAGDRSRHVRSHQLLEIDECNGDSIFFHALSSKAFYQNGSYSYAQFIDSLPSTALGIQIGMDSSRLIASLGNPLLQQEGTLTYACQDPIALQHGNPGVIYPCVYIHLKNGKVSGASFHGRIEDC